MSGFARTAAAASDRASERKSAGVAGAVTNGGTDFGASRLAGCAKPQGGLSRRDANISVALLELVQGFV
jgi:hypothetical protein